MTDGEGRHRGEPVSNRAVTAAARAANRAWTRDAITTSRRLAADPELLEAIERRGF